MFMNHIHVIYIINSRIPQWYGKDIYQLIIGVNELTNKVSRWFFFFFYNWSGNLYIWFSRGIL